MRDDQIQAAIVRICEQGCAYVREAIAALAAGRRIADTADLGPAEHRAVLAELRAIMAVYDARH